MNAVCYHTCLLNVTCVDAGWCTGVRGRKGAFGIPENGMSAQLRSFIPLESMLKKRLAQPELRLMLPSTNVQAGDLVVAELSPSPYMTIGILKVTRNLQSHVIHAIKWNDPVGPLLTSYPAEQSPAELTRSSQLVKIYGPSR